MAPRILSRNEIEGQRIVGLFQTPYRELDGVSACEVFVELDNGVLLELQSQDPMEVLPVVDQREMKPKLIPVALPSGVESCIGETIKTLLTSELKPSLGILLSSGRWLFISDWGPRRIGALIEKAEPNGAVAYWDHAEV